MRNIQNSVNRYLQASVTIAAAAVVAVLFFLLAPLVLLMNWLQRKIKETGSTKCWAAAFTFCKTALVLNVSYLLLRMISNPSSMTADRLNVGNTVTWIWAGLMFTCAILKDRQKLPLHNKQWLQVVVAAILFGVMVTLS